MRSPSFRGEGPAANEDQPVEAGAHFDGCAVVYVVEPDAVLEVRPRLSVVRPPPPPADALEGEHG